MPRLYVGEDEMIEPDLMQKFVPGLELTEAFYLEEVRPLLEKHFPDLKYSAGKLHGGSDVLGFDTPQSMDHDWGPTKIDLFLNEGDRKRYGEDIETMLANHLPQEFRGVPTSFLPPQVDGSRSIGDVPGGRVFHRIAVTTTERFFCEYIGVNPLSGMSEVDWLTVPPQKLRTISSGRIFHGGLGELAEVKSLLSWYPHDLWLYILACQWQRVDQEEPFVARCGDVGDELGSRIVASRLISELMCLCFLMEKSYWPYYKWFGSAFAQLQCAKKLEPIFHSILNSTTWKEREGHLCDAYLFVGKMHNALRLTDPVEVRIAPFWGRPYQVPHSERFVEAIYSQIQSEAILSLPKYCGSIGQFVDSTDVLSWTSRSRDLGCFYTGRQQGGALNRMG